MLRKTLKAQDFKIWHTQMRSQLSDREKYIHENFHENILSFIEFLQHYLDKVGIKNYEINLDLISYNFKPFSSKLPEIKTTEHALKLCQLHLTSSDKKLKTAIYDNLKFKFFRNFKMIEEKNYFFPTLYIFSAADERLGGLDDIIAGLKRQRKDQSRMEISLVLAQGTFQNKLPCNDLTRLIIRFSFPSHKKAILKQYDAFYQAIEAKLMPSKTNMPPPLPLFDLNLIKHKKLAPPELADKPLENSALKETGHSSKKYSLF